jgi:glycogen debranching enzyme
MVTNPALGRGLIAGFRTSGDSERPGFAWYFGRDSMWTALALNAEGDYATTKTALEFLKQFQRDDGKIPHEISQSAADIPWFKDYPYPWNSTDATPLYLIVHADLFRATGDIAFLKANWASLQKAYAHIAATDTDGNGLVENTKFGHGWVEGGALYPPHEEIYLQGVFLESARSYAELADALNDKDAATRARADAARTREATEQTFWLNDRGFYAYATKKATPEPLKAEPGPEKERRQARLNELQNATLYDENTVLTAVPLWWGWLQDDRAQKEIDRLGSANIATDWGARIISNQSRLYDPLSYHYGSVWPLFTGWQSMGAYRYGRPHVGYQALMANSLLTYTSALGYVTELLSGDFNAPFGRSSHHQVWSEAMVVTPALRGLFGLEAADGGKTLKFAPQLPANWDKAAVNNVSVGAARVDLTLERGPGQLKITATRRDKGATPLSLKLSPAFPADAVVKGLRVNNQPLAVGPAERSGDIQRSVATAQLIDRAEVVFLYDEGAEVYADTPNLVAGASSEGLRIVRARAEGDKLNLILEGLGGRSYQLYARTPHLVGATPGVSVAGDAGAQKLSVEFKGEGYIRREIALPLTRRKK